MIKEKLDDRFLRYHLCWGLEDRCCVNLQSQLRTSNINWLCDQVGIDFWFESNDQLRDRFNKEFKR